VFGEIARYLLSDHTLQIRSQENLFLTVLQIGDANTMGEKAPVEGVAGAGFTGALLEKERLIVFSQDEKPLANVAYSINSTKLVKHLVTELDKRREYTVKKDNAVIATGTTGVNGTIAFSDNPAGAAIYTVSLGGKTVVGERQSDFLPYIIDLKNYPNPFSASGASTTISFTLPTTSQSTLAIYNSAGQKIRTLVSGKLASGRHSFAWDAANEAGLRVTNGIYFGRLEVEGIIMSHIKLVLLK
jgi:hypothetical protein